MGVVKKGTELADTIEMPANTTNDGVFAYGGNDLLIVHGMAGRNADFYEMGTGIDTVRYVDTASTEVWLRMDASGASVVNQSTPIIGGARVSDDVIAERIEFTDKKFAIDFYALATPEDKYLTLCGHATEAAKMLGVTFGADSLHNPAYVGIVLNFLDGGGSVETGMGLLIQAAGASTNAAAVDLLWTNLVGSHPTSAEAQPFVDALNNHSMSVAGLGVAAMNLDLNATNINLIGRALTSDGIPYTTGLVSTGLEYL